MLQHVHKVEAMIVGLAFGASRSRRACTTPAMCTHTRTHTHPLPVSVVALLQVVPADLNAWLYRMEQVGRRGRGRSSDTAKRM